jgi:Transglycosylase SLT domain
MRKHLQFALMATSVIATSLSLALPCVQAQAGFGESITVTTDDSGHKVYVNDSVPVTSKGRSRQSDASPVRRNRLVYWSVTENRWKPVPAAHVRAARSAVAEVNEYLSKNSGNNSVATLTSASFSKASFVNPSSANFTPAQIDAAVKRAAERHNVDPNLVRALIKVESNFNPNAVSRKGAMGLMQLMPQTARELKLTNPFDPEQNVDAGVRHLKKLMESFGGNVQLSLAAYNAGAGAVVRSAGIPHFTETRNYVKRITQLYSGGASAGFLSGAPPREPILVQRDAQGALYFSNTE